MIRTLIQWCLQGFIALGLGFFSAFAASPLWASQCSYVEAADAFEAGQRAALLTSYLNWAPVPGTGVADQAERDDDRIGVCRIFADGTVLTHYGCAGKDHLVAERLHDLGNLTPLLAKHPLDLDSTVCVRAYAENLYERPFTEKMFARARPAGDELCLVRSQSPLNRLIRQLCPLDNAPEHAALVGPL